MIFQNWLENFGSLIPWVQFRNNWLSQTREDIRMFNFLHRPQDNFPRPSDPCWVETPYLACKTIVLIPYRHRLTDEQVSIQQSRRNNFWIYETVISIMYKKYNSHGQNLEIEHSKNFQGVDSCIGFRCSFFWVFKYEKS